MNYPQTSVKSLYFDLLAFPTQSTRDEQRWLLGGEVAMWSDNYVGSCLFSNEQDANFSLSASRTIYPRAAIASGTFWGHYQPINDSYFNKTLAAIQARLMQRGVASCPCAALSTTCCSALGLCSPNSFGGRWATSCELRADGTYC